jgi:hypothetical protein
MDWRVVAVLARIIPAHAVVGEGAALAAYRKRQSIRRYWMADCTPNLAGWMKASQRFHRHLHNPGNLYRVVFSIHGVLNRYLLGAEILGDQGREYCHWAACRTAENGAQSLGLLVVGAFVDVRSKCPIALAHGSWRMDSYHNIEVVQGRLSVPALVDMKDKSNIANAFGRPGC